MNEHEFNEYDDISSVHSELVTSVEEIVLPTRGDYYSDLLQAAQTAILNYKYNICFTDLNKGSPTALNASPA